VEVKIGVQSVARELVIETSMTPDDVERALTLALGTSDGIFRITDDSGGQTLVPVDKLGYVEIGKSTSKSVGFGTF
jgi:3-hydroxyacyl-CoA dehydrogenase